MLTAIVSDLHLGTTSGGDIARQPEVRARLLEAIARADRVVLLGDLLEMREQPAPAVLAAARPLLDDLGEATEGKQVVIVPGNHDHELVAPALERARLGGDGRLGLEGTFPTGEGELIRQVTARMPRTDVVLAYPGIRLREDVYATHGHYLDRHLTVPRIECLAASAIARFAVGDAPRAPDTYEAALAPIYAFAYRVVQDGEAKAVTRGGKVSRNIWSRSNPGARRSLLGLAVGRLGIPAGVWAANRMGLGPFRSDISGSELRRAGLRAMAQVVESLGIEADDVIFGHTHRAGPLPGEQEGWTLPGGTRLTNTGSWLYESVFIRDDGPSNPYWPGVVAMLGDEGPPRLENVLGNDRPLRPADLQAPPEGDRSGHA